VELAKVTAVCEASSDGIVSAAVLRPITYGEGKVTITSPVFLDPRPIWVSTGRSDPYPWRFRIARGVTRPIANAVPAGALVERLAFTRRWPRAHWRLAFQGNLHEISRRDFGVIERAIAR